MKTPPLDAIEAAIEWLRVYDGEAGDPETKYGMDDVADWLAAIVITKAQQQEARRLKVPVSNFRAAIVKAEGKDQ